MTAIVTAPTWTPLRVIMQANGKPKCLNWHGRRSL
jgi:hypothetical protein